MSKLIKKTQTKNIDSWIPEVNFSENLKEEEGFVPLFGDESVPPPPRKMKEVELVENQLYELSLSRAVGNRVIHEKTDDTEKLQAWMPFLNFKQLDVVDLEFDPENDTGSQSIVIKSDLEIIATPPLKAVRHVLKESTPDEEIQGWDIPAFIQREQPIIQNETDFDSIREQIEKEKNEAQALLIDARQNAAAIIDNANNVADLTIEKAGNESDRIREEAYEKGMLDAADKGGEIIESAISILNEMQKWQNQVMVQSEPLIIQIISMIAQKLFGEGFILEPTVLEVMIMQSIGEASRLGDLRIYLHPDDAKAIISLWQESELVLNGQKISIVASQNILRGGCFIEGEFGEVDARIEDQLNIILRDIKRTMENKDKDET